MAFLLPTLTIASFAALARAQFRDDDDNRRTSTTRIVAGVLIALAILMSVISCFIYSARRRRALALYQMQRQNYANQVQHNNVYRNPGYDVNQPQGWMGPPPAGPPPPGYTPAPYPGQQAYYPDGAAPPPNPPEYGKTGYDGFPMPTGQPFGTQTPGSPGQGASYQPPAGPPPAHLHP